MRFQIVEHPWPVSDKFLIPVGAIIDGATTATGLELRWQGQVLPTQCLPINAAPADGLAAEALQRQYAGDPRLRAIAPIPAAAKPPAAVPAMPPAMPAQLGTFRWTLSAPWAAGSVYLEAGVILDGVERNGELVSVHCGSVAVPLPLPFEASPLTQAAADMMAKWYPFDLPLLRPGPGVVIRPWPGGALTAAEAAYDHALAGLDGLRAEAKAIAPALAALAERLKAYAKARAKQATLRRGL
jgi:hypothetical protein